MNRLYELSCSGIKTPLALDSSPRFSWKYELASGFLKGYEITVKDSNKIVWISGFIESNNSCHIQYEGLPLEPLTEYEWSVKISGTEGSCVTAQDTFRTGFMGKAWTGHWIGACFHKKQDDATDAPYIRKAFLVESNIVSAYLHICSPGYHDAYLNGIRVGDDLLATPYTAFDRTLFYITYDVTDLIKTGENAFGSLIGTGWYNCFTKDVWNTPETSWRHIPKMMAEIHIEFSDGKKKSIVTDRSWKCEKSPIFFNGIRNGEYYDSRLEIANWNKAGFDDSSWNPVKVVRAPGGVLKAMEIEPERVVKSWESVSSWKTTEDTWIFDAGVNMAGFSEITVNGIAGTEITIKYSERLKDDGVHIDPKTNSGFVRSGDFQTDRYIKNSDGPETWRPRFVYHGFQYVEVSGCSIKPKLMMLMVNTDVSDTGSFECSNDTLNKIHKAARRATLSNLHSVPTDDPHREKNAWTGDVSLSAEQMLYNFDSAPVLRKWLGDIRDAQRPDGAIPCVVPSTGWGYNWGNGPDWSSALTLIPWYIYVMSGDISVLNENYEAVKRHFCYMESMAEDNIVGYGIGDWCPPFEGRAVSVSMSSFKTPVEVTDTAYYYNTANVISKMAEALGRNDESLKFRDKAEKIKVSFREKFYDGETAITGDCQTSTSCMIYQGLTEPDEKPELLKLLKRQISINDYHQDTGILGNKYIYNTLGESGNMATALRMILNDTYPSFKNWIDMGATTLWECWNGEGSRNHHMFSDISAVFYKYLGGIRADENDPGFRHILISPAVNCGLKYVSCSFESQYGSISSNWEIKEDTLNLNITVPCGCKAALSLPYNFRRDEYPNELAAGTHDISIKPIPIKEGLEKYYDAYANLRENTIKSGWKLDLRKKVRDKLITEGANTLLEIGCGTGQDCLYFSDEGFSVKGIDLSKAHVEYCIEKGVDAQVMDLYDIQFEDAVFDAIYTINCLLHVPVDETVSVLSSISRVLKKSGIMFVGNYGGDYEGLSKFDDQGLGRFFSFRPYEEYAQVVESSGFKIIEGGKLNTDTPFEFNYFILRKI